MSVIWESAHSIRIINNASTRRCRPWIISRWPLPRLGRDAHYLVDDFVDSVLRKAEAAGLSPVVFRDHSVNREKIS